MKKIGIFVVIGVVLIVLVSQFIGSESNYKDKVKQERDALLSFMQRSSQSPFKGLEKPDSLVFFDVNEQYRVFAQVEKVEGRDIQTIQKTLNQSDTYFVIAKLLFSIKGQNQTLYVYENEENPNDILLPFVDESNGEETYETGRYLHIKKSALAKKEVELDFNLATNPYCAYNDEYSCPIPPKENTMLVKVLAGEKKYKQ